MTGGDFLLRRTKLHLTLEQQAGGMRSRIGSGEGTQLHPQR